STQMLSPPERPREFRHPNELRQYLKELNEYYAIMGRTRF
uniref:Neuropeptide F n=1 Tax=Cornu aspersum TaxID=6535 RepID=NPF_CORAP|nr:RecName: Full=Neuropeptide F; Short=NPF [Cornu aspersum]AAB24383.1 neuropeptide F, NPF [Helix aspersa=garden snails, circumoesophageal ganglia, Peptide, 39 aa] [Cornu aspersum]